MHRFANPLRYQRVADAVLPWAGGAAVVLMVLGLYLALIEAPPDYQQGQAYRIMYVHVPAAWMALMVYALMAAASVIGIVWRHPLAETAARAAAPIGAAFTAIALVTGSLWGKPMWGTYWVWDPRITFELLLLFLYLGYMGLRSAFDDLQRADRVSAVLAIVGIVDVPIIHYSVIWWNSLHQAPSLMKFSKPTMPPEMYIPILAMFLGFTLLFAALLLTRLRAEVLNRERAASWIRDVVSA
jgi:heme exporter protein C